MPLPLLLLLLLLSISPSLSSTSHFTPLHVHQLLAATRTQTQTRKHTRHPNPPRSVAGEVALDLFHRDKLQPGPNRSSHHHLLSARLRRDSYRVATLAQLLTGPSSSSPYRVSDFGSDVISGLDEGSGEYFVRVGVGSPPRYQYLVIDSGSDVVWVQCQPCTQCYTQSDPLFDPAESNSFMGIPCGSPICDLLSSAAAAGCHAGGGCRYEVSYGDGSSTHGTLALETLTFGPTAVRGVALGCGHRNRGLFVGAAGLLGLGWGPLSLVGQLAGQLGSAFGYCLVSRGGAAGSGSLTFGRAAAVPAGAAWVPLLRNPRAPSFYYVSLVGLGVGGARLPLPESTFALAEDGSGGAVLDTGTAVTRLPESAYVALRESFVAGTLGLPRAPAVSIFDTCYDLSGYGSVRVPTVSFYFGGVGAVLTLPARNFMIPVDGEGTFCLALAAAAEGSGLTIVGNIQQEGIQITVDAATGFVGFGPHTC